MVNQAQEEFDPRSPANFSIHFIALAVLGWILILAAANGVFAIIHISLLHSTWEVSSSASLLGYYREVTPVSGLFL